MWISIIAALVCFAVSIILFTPSFRGFSFYRPLSFYFLYNGLWCILNFVISTVWVNSDIMIWVNYIGTIMFAGYLLFALYAYYFKDNNIENKINSSNKNK